jgi:DNA-binding NarL/FixJ family response regulator
LLAVKGITNSYRGEDSPEEWFVEAEQLDPSVDIRIHTWSMRGDIALRRGRYPDAVARFAECVEQLRARSGAPNDAACWLVWALAAAGQPDAARRALDDARVTPDDLARWYARPTVTAAAAALVDGDAERLESVFAAAPARMPFDLALMRMLAAEILGGPLAAEWLRQALATYDAAGCELESARVRRMLRDAGAPVPRRRRAAGTVPAELEALGVTAREADVLRLLGEGLPNAAIAERLFISVRTVETHVSSLLAKLQVDSRGQLTARSLAVTFTPRETLPG